MKFSKIVMMSVILALFHAPNNASAKSLNLICDLLPGHSVAFTGKIEVDGPYDAPNKGFMRGGASGVIQFRAPGGKTDTAVVNGEYIQAQFGGYETALLLFGVGKSGTHYFINTSSGAPYLKSPGVGKIQVNQPGDLPYRCEFRYAQVVGDRTSSTLSMPPRCHGAPGNCLQSEYQESLSGRRCYKSCTGGVCHWICPR